MAKYEVIIYWSKEDDAYIAEVPELPGCAADGATYKKALENVEVIINEWIATAKELGRPIPEPSRRPIDDGVLSIAKSEAGLLGLIAIEFEARNAGQSFKKKIAGALGVSERYIGDLLHGKANATPHQLHAIAQACDSDLFKRWLTIHFIRGGVQSERSEEERKVSSLAA